MQADECNDCFHVHCCYYNCAVIIVVVVVSIWSYIGLDYKLKDVQYRQKALKLQLW